MKPVSLLSAEMCIAKLIGTKPTELFVYPDLREDRWRLSARTMAGARFIGAFTKDITAEELLADANFAVYERA